MWQMAAGLLAGSCAVLSLPQAPPVALAWIVPAALASLRLRAGAALAAGPGRGFWLTALQLNAGLADRLDPALEGQALRVRGVVASVPQGTLERAQVPLRAAAGRRRAPLPRLLELTWYDAPAPRRRRRDARTRGEAAPATWLRQSGRSRQRGADAARRRRCQRLRALRRNGSAAAQTRRSGIRCCSHARGVAAVIRDALGRTAVGRHRRRARRRACRTP